METVAKIAFGGGCYWCTEAVFQSLKGVRKVHQGFISSTGEHYAWSEAVIVEYLKEEISLKDLIAVHVSTHNSTSAHSLRKRYRSAVYFFNENDAQSVQYILTQLQADFTEKLITQALPFSEFKPSEEQYKNYYYSNPKRPFCETYITPKLILVSEHFSSLIKLENMRE